MEQGNQLSEYRRYLLGMLSEHAGRRSYEDRPGQCQVLVNHERVGILDCTSIEPTFTFTSREQGVANLEIRAEDGTVLGVLSAPEFGFKTSQIQIGRHDLELTIHNRLQGGTATATFKAASSRLKAGVDRRVQRRAGEGQGVFARSGRHWALVAAQVALFVAVAGLVADRLSGRLTIQAPDLVSGPASPQPVANGEVERLEARLALLSRSHEAAVQTVRTQQDELVKLKQAVSTLGATPRDMKTKVVTARGAGKPLGRRDVQREVETMAEMLIGRADADQEQLREEIRGLAVANEKLAKQLSALEAGNQELKNRLKSAGVDVSKAALPGESRPAVALQPLAGGSVQLAEKPAPHNSVLFWVSFQEGTTEQNIEQFVTELHGRKGPRRAEWTSLEVDLPDPDHQAGFLESVKKKSFVKAVAMKLDTPPAP